MGTSLMGTSDEGKSRAGYHGRLRWGDADFG